MRYPVTLTPDSGGYVVSFPDVPEALSQGDTREEALANALDALVTAFEFYFEDNERIPEPGPVVDEFVEVPSSFTAKVLMLNAFVESGLTRVELASRMGVKKQEITRLFDLNHTTKIDTIRQAMAAMNKPLTLSSFVQLDVYQVSGAEDQLSVMLKKGEAVHFVASPITDPKAKNLYSGVLVANEYPESSFIVIKNFVQVGNEIPEHVNLSKQPVMSIVAEVSHLAVNCLIK